MTITIHTWHIMIVLFFIPILYGTLRRSGGDYDFALDVFGLTILCWGIDIGILIGKLF